MRSTAVRKQRCPVFTWKTSPTRIEVDDLLERRN